MIDAVTDGFRVVTRKGCGRSDGGQNDQKLTIKVKCCIGTSMWKSLLSHSPIKIICVVRSSRASNTDAAAEQLWKHHTAASTNCHRFSFEMCATSETFPQGTPVSDNTYPSHTSRIIEDKGRFYKKRENIENTLSD